MLERLIHVLWLSSGDCSRFGARGSHNSDGEPRSYYEAPNHMIVHDSINDYDRTLINYIAG